MKKKFLARAAWLKDVAPSNGLRRWFTHDHKKWPEFQRHYRAELNKDTGAYEPILQAARRSTVTLL